MIVAIVLAFICTVVLLALGRLVERKLSPNPIPADWVWCVWVVVVVLVCVAWWRLVIGQFIGPLP